MERNIKINPILKGFQNANKLRNSDMKKLVKACKENENNFITESKRNLVNLLYRYCFDNNISLLNIY